MDYVLPKKCDLQSLITMKYRATLLDYTRIIGYNYDQFLATDYNTGEKATPVMIRKNNQLSVEDIIGRVDGRPGYQAIFFE
jgi:hypothetical protein